MSRNPLLDPVPTRIALAGDWHGQAEYATEAIMYAAARGAQGIIQLGDLGIWPGHSGRLFLRAVDTALAEAGIWGAFIDGNHEDFWQLHSLPLDEHGLRPVTEHLWHLPRGYRWQWKARWLALGGAVSLDRKQRTLGKSWWPEETITNAEMTSVIDGGPADIMLTHDCPAGVDIPGLLPDAFWDADGLRNARAHQQILRTIVDEVGPSLLIHGHFHVHYHSVVAFERGRCLVRGLGDDGCVLEENVIMLDL